MSTPVIAPRLSIVVPTYQRRDSVLRLLRALDRQSASPDLFEVIVVADGSTDGTGDAVDAHRASYALRHVWQPQGGIAIGRNHGARIARGDLVMFLDDDMEPSAGMVSGHLEPYHDPSVLGVVGAAPIVVPADASPVVRYRARGFGRKLERLAGRRDRLVFNDVYGGNLSIRRAPFLAAGGYDEAFRAYGHEDYELSIRLVREGGRFTFAPAALAQQHYEKTFRQLAANIEAEGATAVLFARKQPEALPSLQLGSLTRRSRVTRLSTAALVTLARVYAPLRERMIAAVERAEARAAPSDAEALFARYDRVLDALYWIGAERALHEGGAPRYAIAVLDVARWIAASARVSSTPRPEAPRPSATTP